MEIVLRLSRNMTIVVHSVAGVRKRTGISPYQNYNFSVLIEILVRFGSVTPKFKEVRTCTDGVDNCYNA